MKKQERCISLQLWPFTSYKWWFLWDSTFYFYGVFFILFTGKWPQLVAMHIVTPLWLVWSLEIPVAARWCHFLWSSAGSWTAVLNGKILLDPRWPWPESDPIGHFPERFSVLENKPFVDSDVPYYTCHPCVLFGNTLPDWLEVHCRFYNIMIVT